MKPYFKKAFECVNLRVVEYVKCTNCGFVMSKTHYELSSKKWQAINDEFHAEMHGKEYCQDDPQWVQRLHAQAAIIDDASTLGLIPKDSPWVDFGCGDAKLSDILKKVYALELQKFDRYKEVNGYLKEKQLKEKYFGFVITTSVFEHLLERKMFDEINSLVSSNGVMGLHTLVAEEIPDDPEWFYLVPVHCAFFTNKAMQMLFDQWGFTCSVYNVNSRLWLFFKQNSDLIENIVRQANKRVENEGLYYHFKRGFMDYWKLKKNQVVKRINS